MPSLWAKVYVCWWRRQQMKHAPHIRIESPPVSPEPEAPAPRKLDVNVVFTDMAATASALRRARQCAQALGAQIDLLYWQEVPRFFDLSAPPVSLNFIRRRLYSLTSAFCPDVPVHVRVYLCRHLEWCLERILNRESLVILGGKKRWWISREEKLANKLASRGYMVLFVDCSRPNQMPCPGANSNRAGQGLHVY